MQTHDIDGDRDPLARRALEQNAAVEAKVADGRQPGGLGPAAVTHLQRAAGNAAVSSLLGGETDQESPVKDVIRSSGAPLDRDTRSLMETRLGHDFSDVRVHTDSAAAASAKSVQAQAYTVDNHVVFGEGRYNAGSPETTRTLAHELTHVVQQRNGPVDGTPAAGGIKVSDPSDRFEREAERSADQVMSGGLDHTGAQADQAGHDHSVQRQEGEEEEVQGLFLQRQEGEEEEVQGLFLQRQEEEEEG